MNTTSKPNFKRAANGGWCCEIDGVRFTFFRPTPGVPFFGVDFKGDWRCRMYAADGVYVTRAATREGGINELLEGLGEKE